MKTCTKCGVQRLLSDFHKHSGSPDRLSYWCKKCVLEHAVTWRKNNSERFRATRRAWNARPESKVRHRAWVAENKDRQVGYQRKYKYGITTAEFDTMMASQNNTCLLCGLPFGSTKGQSPAVDHDHDTGAIRGILHGNCNRGLGFFRDDPQLLDAARFYLKWHGGKR